MLHHRWIETKAVYFVDVQNIFHVGESHRGQKLHQQLLLVLLAFFSILGALSRHFTSPLSLMLCGWMDHPLQSLPLLGRAPTRQYVSPQNLITGNQDSVQEAVVQLVLISPVLCPHLRLLAALVLEKRTVTISTLRTYQPCLIPLVR